MILFTHCCPRCITLKLWGPLKYKVSDVWKIVTFFIKHDSPRQLCEDRGGNLLGISRTIKPNLFTLFLALKNFVKISPISVKKYDRIYKISTRKLYDGDNWIQHLSLLISPGLMKSSSTFCFVFQKLNIILVIFFAFSRDIIIASKYYWLNN